MKNIYSGAKRRVRDTFGTHPTATVPGNAARIHEEFPSEGDLYCYRKQRGVNLGSWFVLERWITETPFKAAAAPAQSDLDVAKGENAKGILERHWDTWITEDDWNWLSATGINTVRIPIGYYHICGADPSVLHSTDFAGLDDIFAGAWSRITNALSTAYKHKIGVLFDLHAAPGKQNADSHSGTSLEPKFFSSAKLMSHTIDILATFTKHITAYGRENQLPNLIGIELLNEPQPGSHNQALKKWYLDAIRAVRKVNPYLPVYISDSWMTDQYADFIKSSGTEFTVLDHHLYRCFTHDDISTPAAEHARRLRDPNDGTASLFSRTSGKLRESCAALVVGEWSAALNPASLHGAGDEVQAKRAYVEAQLQLFDQHCAGWFFWTYKKESRDTGWSLRDVVEAGVFPTGFRSIKGTPAGEDSERDARKQAAQTSASEQHKAYWSQYPGDYEHWRLEEGFSAGWDDAYLFARQWAELGSLFLEEVGFKGPWMNHRKEQLESRIASKHVWEWDHGFIQGYVAATEDMTNVSSH
ncbi:glycoside hydrolase [Dichomitus squalens]|uniref:Glycoside hydrolase n=1 Tax=Dichomitus squalens TaxID=114155 RepID=A0A4Q9NAX8_9APHY|nr:glycoside hydrolase [Dichomitus squalens]TBU60740.1 glycoside hydrolase [Dichomitus squalens]